MVISGFPRIYISLLLIIKFSFMRAEYHQYQIFFVCVCYKYLRTAIWYVYSGFRVSNLFCTRCTKRTAILGLSRIFQYQITLTVTNVTLHYEVRINILFPWYLCHFIFIERDMINGYNLFTDWYSLLIMLKLFIY